MDKQRESYHQGPENNGSCFLGSGTSAVVWRSASAERQARTSTYFGVQTNGLHGGGIIWIGAVVEGLPTATEATTEGAVAVRVVHLSRVGRYREIIVSGGGGREGGEEDGG